MVVQASPIESSPPHGRGISLTSSELRKLRSIARNPKAERDTRANAKALLLAAQACSNQEIAEKLDLAVGAVDRLRERFARCRLAAVHTPPDVVLPPLEEMLAAPVGKARPIRLQDFEREWLEATIRAATAQQRAVLRAKVVLLAAQGRNNCEIADELRVDVKTVRKWRTRFAAERLDGLYDLARTGRPAKFEASQRLEAIAAMLKAPPEVYARWSLDLAVEALIDAKIVPSLSRETLSRWLRTADLKPHRCRYWLNSKDPDFNAKMERITALYLNKPKDGRVISIDEKTCIPVREHLRPERPMKPGRVRQPEYEYKRHGVVHLIAAFDVHTGEVVAECVDKNNSAAFIEFLCKIRRKYPGEKLYLILDNGTTHRSKKTKKFLAKHPWLGTPVFTPTHASWLNQIEIWFSVLTRQALRHVSFRDRQELIDRIFAYVALHNEEAKPYKWTKTGEALRI